MQVLAGDGTACSAAADACGDGGPAVDAQLFFPKGIAYDGEGNLFGESGIDLLIFEWNYRMCRICRIIDSSSIVFDLLFRIPVVVSG